LISIIVPIYNSEKYLPKCIESLQNQTYQNLEILLIDDGSQDSSLEICNRYAKKDPRIKVFHKNNEGQGAARNFGLDRCNGEYIAFVDSDDYVLEDIYFEMYEAMKTHCSDLVICGLIRDHKFLKRLQPIPDKKIIYNNEQLMEAYISTKFITTSVCNKLYAKILWKEIRFPHLRAKEDVTIMHELLSKSKKSIHVGIHGYMQYVRLGSTERSNFNESKLASIQANEKLVIFINKYYPQLASLTTLKIAKTYILLMEEILVSFQYSMYRETYNNLLFKLGNELKYMTPQKKEKSLQYSEILNVYKKQKTFIFKCYFKGIKIKLINFVSKNLQKFF